MTKINFSKDEELKSEIVENNMNYFVQTFRGNMLSVYDTTRDIETTSYYFAIEPSTSLLFCEFFLGCSDQIECELFEDADYSHGTNLNVFNRNRVHASQVDGVVISSQPTVVSEGNVLCHTIEGTTVSNKIGNNASLGSGQFFILKPNTKYLVKLTFSSTPVDLTFVFNFIPLS